MGFFRLSLACLALTAVLVSPVPASAQAVGGSPGTLRTWEGNANRPNRDCGQGCLYNKANENLALIAFYYYRLVTNAEEAMQNDAGVGQLQSMMGQALCPNGNSAETCMSRLRAVAFVAIQRYQASIHKNTLTKNKLDDEAGKTTRFDSLATHNRLNADGSIERALQSYTPNFLTAQEIASLSQDRMGNIQSVSQLAVAGINDPSAGFMTQLDNTNDSAQDQFIDWMGKAENAEPQLTDFVAFRKVAGGRMEGYETQAQCTARPGQVWQGGMCYDNAAFTQALAAFQTGFQVNGRSAREDRLELATDLQQSVRANPNLRPDQFVKQYGSNIDPQSIPVARPGQAPTLAPSNLKAYVEARGTFLRTADEEIANPGAHSGGGPALGGTRPRNPTTGRQVAGQTGLPPSAAPTATANRSPLAPLGTPGAVGANVAVQTPAQQAARQNQIITRGLSADGINRPGTDQRDINLVAPDSTIEQMLTRVTDPSAPAMIPVRDPNTGEIRMVPSSAVQPTPAPPSR